MAVRAADLRIAAGECEEAHVDEVRWGEDGGCGSGRGGGRGGIHACIKGVSLLLPGERQPLGFINLVLLATCPVPSPYD